MTSTLFERCLAASLVFHAGLFLSLRLLKLRGPGPALPGPIEIDLTKPFLPGGPAKLGAPKRLIPQAPPGPALPAETAKPPEVAAPQPPREWVLPGPETKDLEKQPEPGPTPGGTPEGTGTAAMPGGSGEGANVGVPGGTGIGGTGAALLRPPRLLNREEVLANLRRFYPESERRIGREGTVLLTLRIGPDGTVGPVEVAQSAGAAFDNAAKAVAFLMRFAPAEGQAGPVPVKISQAMVFRLTED